MRAAQNHVVQDPDQAGDFYGGHAGAAVEGEQDLGRYHAAVLTIPATAGLVVLAATALVWEIGRLARRSSWWRADDRRRLLLLITIVVTVVALGARGRTAELRQEPAHAPITRRAAATGHITRRARVLIDSSATLAPGWLRPARTCR